MIIKRQQEPSSCVWWGEGGVVHILTVDAGTNPWDEIVQNLIHTRIQVEPETVTRSVDCMSVGVLVVTFYCVL